MATSKATTNVPVASILHFSFTLVSVIFLSYKVFHLERELKTVRDKLLSQAPINPGKQTTVISSSGKDVRSNRTPRLGRNLQTLGSSTSGTLKNVCLEKWIQALQVCLLDVRSAEDYLGLLTSLFMPRETLFGKS